MSKGKRYILTITLLSFTVLIYSRINYTGFSYLLDLYRSIFIEICDVLSPDETDFKIVDLNRCKKYTYTYGKLPEGFIHFGHFLLFRAPRDTPIRDLARQSIIYTHYYRSYQLEESIREYNGLDSGLLGRGDTVFIPYSLPPYLPEVKKSIKPRIIFSRGIYYTGNSIGSVRILRRIGQIKKAGINTVVFDAKDVTGIVNYFSHVPAVIEFDTHRKRSIDNIDKLIRYLKSREIFIIARIAVFRDHLLYKASPQLAIQSRRGGLWNRNENELWVDPTNRTVQDYNIELAIELAEKGVDEIQFDYIRFPTLGNLSDAAYAYDFGRISKEETITRFLKRAYHEIARRNTLLSIDIFGVVAWSKPIDIRKTGQRIETLSRYCDVISPMLYPSHFNDDFEGFTNPGDNPYHFIFHGCKRVQKLSRRAVRPWLQAFKWRVSNYDETYIMDQVYAAIDAGAFGYLFWNASNNYDIVFSALRKMKGAKRRAHNHKTEKVSRESH